MFIRSGNKRNKFPSKKELEETLGKKSASGSIPRFPSTLPINKLIPLIVSLVLIVSMAFMLMQPSGPSYLTPSGNISYFWDFGDGSTAIGANPYHSYDQPGDYTITLIVTNGTGFTTTEFDISAQDETMFFAVSPVANISSESIETCTDGIDNDGNGLTDSDDPGCYIVEICDDGVDNDLDRLIDYSDPDCYRVETGKQCFNNIDDDGDGVADCWDPDCECAEQGLESEDVCYVNCDDGEDNDGDGLIDCDDPMCETASNCKEN